jgi:hypothetical protein
VSLVAIPPRAPPAAENRDTPAGVRKIAEAAIRKAVQAKDDPADLINVVLEELVRARCEPPGYTTLDAMAAAIRVEVNNGF